MSKRKLNRRQTDRTAKIQQKKFTRASEKHRNLGQQTQPGELSSEQHGLVICRYSKHFEVEALENPNKGLIYHCVTRANIAPIVTGDRVIWRAAADQTGVIESCLQRQSILQRPDNFGKLKPVAANIEQMLIVIACKPAPQPSLIDRYLVAAELMNVQPIIILNKVDLVNDSNRNEIEHLLSCYRQLNYPVVKIISSRHQAAKLSNLPDLIKQRTSIVVGQSGVGKSSLINTLLPKAKLKVGELSESSGEGIHTTTHAALFHLPNGGQLIDSPGIRDFSLWHINKLQLQQGFIEIAQQQGHCRFRDCQHKSEPDCAVLAAVNNGTISKHRFSSYLSIKKSIEAQQARGLVVSRAE